MFLKIFIPVFLVCLLCISVNPANTTGNAIHAKVYGASKILESDSSPEPDNPKPTPGKCEACNGTGKSGDGQGQCGFCGGTGKTSSVGTKVPSHQVNVVTDNHCIFCKSWSNLNDSKFIAQGWIVGSEPYCNLRYLNVDIPEGKAAVLALGFNPDQLARPTFIYTHKGKVIATRVGAIKMAEFRRMINAPPDPRPIQKSNTNNQQLHYYYPKGTIRFQNKRGKWRRSNQIFTQQSCSQGYCP